MEDTLYLENLVENTETEQSAEEPEFQLATVASVGTDGVTLTFDGSDTASTKEYKVNTSALLKAGDRVKITKESGSYIVDYAIGAPNARYPLPSGGTSGQCLQKGSSTDYDVEWGTAHQIPSGGSSGQVLAKGSATSYDVEWKTVTEYSGPTINGSSTTTLGFYGQTAKSRQTVAKASTSATLADVITALNNLNTALVNLGLIKNY